MERPEAGDIVIFANMYIFSPLYTRARVLSASDWYLYVKPLDGLFRFKRLIAMSDVRDILESRKVDELETLYAKSKP